MSLRHVEVFRNGRGRYVWRLRTRGWARVEAISARSWSSPMDAVRSVRASFGWCEAVIDWTSRGPYGRVLLQQGRLVDPEIKETTS